MGLIDVDFTPESQGGLEMSMDEIVKLGDSDTESTEVQKDDTTEEVKKEEKNPNELDLNLDALLKDDEEIDEKVDIEEVKDKPSSAQTKETTTNSSFLLLTKALAEEGILEDLDEEGFNKLVDEQGSGGKALLHLVNSRLEETENKIKDSYDADYKEFLQLKELGIPKEDAFDLVSIDTRLNEIDDDILEESEDVRKEILEMHFKNTTKWSDDKIVKHVEKLVTNGEDIDAAKEALPDLQKLSKEMISQRKEEAVRQNELLQKQQQEAAEEIRKTLVQDAEIVKNVKLTKAQAIKAQELLLTPVELEDGNVTNVLYAERAKNPLEFDKKLAALIAAGAFEGNVTTTKASKKNALDELEKVVSSGARTSFKSNMEANNDVLDEQSQIANDRFLNWMKNNK